MVGRRVYPQVQRAMLVGVIQTEMERAMNSRLEVV
jgi:hypothetical protein